MIRGMQFVSGSSDVPGWGDGEDLVEWLARRRRQSAADAARAVRVVGLSVPVLGGMLSEWQSGDTVQLTLAYGAMDAAGGPYVEVVTVLDQDGHVWPLAEVLAQERDRLFDHAGVDEPDPDDARDAAVTMTLDDLRLPGQARREGAVWAAQALVPRELEVGGRRQSAAVTVVARGVAIEDVRLALVRDLTPLIVAGDALFRAKLANRSPHQPAVTPPSGIDGHAKLVESILADAHAHTPRRRYPRRPRGEHSQLWEIAVLGQMHLAGQTHDEANHAVTLLVNQLLRLATTVTWWDEHGQAAVTESIRFTAFDSDVPSRSAQLVWPDLFTGGHPGRPAARHTLQRPPSLNPQVAWSEAWRSWQAQQPT